MNVQILQSAETEIAEAMDYYNIQYQGLGYEFAAEVKESINRIIAFPDAWSIFDMNTRKCSIKRFPYAIFYETEQSNIVIFAVMHLKQNPKTWKERLNSYKKI